MKIPLFEILVLIFVLWPLIQRFLEKNKPKPGAGTDLEVPYGESDDPFAESPRKAGQKPDWEEAMRELEMIFTGERPSQPTPREIEESSQRRATMDQRRQDGTDRSAALRAQAELGSSRRESMLRQQNVTQQSRRLNPDLGNTRRTELEQMTSRRLIKKTVRPEEMASAEEMVEQLMESENPIYTSLNDAPEIQTDAASRSFTVFEDVRDPQRLREFFVMKEILDKPVSLRRVRNFV